MQDEILYSPKEIVRSGLCIGCGSCVAMEGLNRAKMEFDKYGELKPSGERDWFHQSTHQFSQSCPFSPVAKNENELADVLYPLPGQKNEALGHFQTAYVGHVAEEDFRAMGSSGGMVTWVATELLKNGLIDGVAHVVASEDPQANGNFFYYRMSRSVPEIQAGAKSRYYPVELSGILKTIRDTPGKYAVVGIPCFIKAIQLLRLQDAVLHERIKFTLGLFCGHMKSARFVESIAWQLNVPVSEIKKIDYRYKDTSRPANWYNTMFTLNDGRSINKDWWHLGDGDWGAGFFMNNACNFCDDVMAETADISFGDAWVEPYASDGRGTNVVVVRSAIIQKTIEGAIQEKRLQLKEVDGNFVAQTQAAGLRQRREGLAYRLTWNRHGIQPVKRVTPDDKSITKERKRIYRMRYQISKWSHRVFFFAKQTRQPKIYIAWSRLVNALYYAFAYHNGKFSEIKKRLSGFKNP
jgi:coenzyme F420-reducing hydrogenase beta subunit